jgi:hypothetical protein
MVYQTIAYNGGEQLEQHALAIDSIGINHRIGEESVKVITRAYMDSELLSNYCFSREIDQIDRRLVPRLKDLLISNKIRKFISDET